jgi:CheY-like chemotaxis protein
VSPSPSKRALIVEDDAATQRLLAVLLERAGFATTIAFNGEAAMDFLGQGSYELIVLDLMMPKVGGHAVIDYLAARQIPTPVIVCTAAHATGDLNSKIVKAVLRKPFDIEQMLALAEAVVQPPPRVLIVDDDTQARFVMRSFAEPAEVTEAGSAETAMRLIGERHPDVILLDLTLPGQSGEEMLDELRASDATAGIPVVVVSSRQLDADERERLLRRTSGIIYKSEMSRAALSGMLHVVLRDRS